jgi:hypothetical protein
MPYQSDAQRRYLHARHPGIAERWDEEARSTKRNEQPSFGNGGKGHGRRMKDDKKVGKADDSHRGRRAAIGGTAGAGATTAALYGGVTHQAMHEWKKASPEPITVEQARRLVRGSLNPKSAVKTFARFKRGYVPVAAAGAATGAVGGALSGRRRQPVGKSRFYDPEHRRQRRLGMGQAALTGAGAAGLAIGGRGALKSTKAVRALTVRAPKGSPKAGSFSIAHGDTPAGKGILALRRRDAAALAGGTAGLGGALGLRSYAESRRGTAWR